MPYAHLWVGHLVDLFHGGGSTKADSLSSRLASARDVESAYQAVFNRLPKEYQTAVLAAQGVLARCYLESGNMPATAVPLSAPFR